MPIAEAHARSRLQKADQSAGKGPRSIFETRAAPDRTGRVWVVFQQETLVFKADVVAETAEVMYLEGIYVDPKKTRTGHRRQLPVAA
jgi:predicted GNAT family acetyltransferase